MFGSANFDNRSLELNDELNVAVSEPRSGGAVPRRISRKTSGTRSGSSWPRGGHGRCWKRRASSSGATSVRYSEPRPACQRLPHRPSRSSISSTWPNRLDLAALRASIGAGAAAARFLPKSGAPPYVQYAVPPVIVDGEGLGLTEIDGFRPRLKFFDYGVVSLALSRPFAGDWAQFIALSLQYIENDDLERRAADVCRDLSKRFAVGDARTARDVPGRGLPGVRGQRARRPHVRGGTRRRAMAKRSRCCCEASASRSVGRSKTRSCGTACRISLTTSSSRRGTRRSCMTRRPAARRRSRSSSSPTRSCSSSGTTTSCSIRNWAGSTPKLQRRALVRRSFGSRLHSRRQGSARAVHRRERDHRPDGERVEDGRRHLLRRASSI